MKNKVTNFTNITTHCCIHPWYLVLSSIFRKVGVFCSYVSYVRIKYRFGITAQLLGGASIGSHFQEEKAPKKKSAQEKKRTTPKEERIFGHFGSDSEESARSQRKSAPSHGKDLALWEAGEQAQSTFHGDSRAPTIGRQGIYLLWAPLSAVGTTVRK